MHKLLQCVCWLHHDHGLQGVLHQSKERERENWLDLLLLIKIQYGRRFVSRSKSFFSWQKFFIHPITPRSFSYPCRLNLSATSNSLSHKSDPPALLWLQLLVSVLLIMKNSNYLATCQEGLPELSGYTASFDCHLGVKGHHYADTHSESPELASEGDQLPFTTSMCLGFIKIILISRHLNAPHLLIPNQNHMQRTKPGTVTVQFLQFQSAKLLHLFTPWDALCPRRFASLSLNTR